MWCSRGKALSTIANTHSWMYTLTVSDHHKARSLHKTKYWDWHKSSVKMPVIEEACTEVKLLKLLCVLLFFCSAVYHQTDQWPYRRPLGWETGRKDASRHFNHSHFLHESQSYWDRKDKRLYVMVKNTLRTCVFVLPFLLHFIAIKMTKSGTCL